MSAPHDSTRQVNESLPTGYLIKLVDEAFRYELDAVLKMHALSTATYAALYHLHASGEAVSSASLARASWVTPQTMSRLVKTLKKSDFIMVAAQQGRTCLLSITTRGEQVLEQAKLDVMALEQAMVMELSATQQHMLRAMLVTCHGALTRRHEHSPKP